MRTDDRGFTQMCKSLGDEISFAIIKSTINQSMSAMEIAKVQHVPLSSVYNKIRKLKALGLVDVERIDIDSRSGKKISCYRGRVESLELSLSGTDTRMRIEAHIPTPDAS